MKSIVVDGQLSLFDEQPKVVNIILTKEENKDNTIFKELIDKYGKTCTRIAKVEQKLYVEVNNQTLSFESDGEASHIFVKNMLLRPKDEIENINKMHEEIEEDPKVEGVTEISESEETLRLGDKVKFDYHGPKEGNIVRIYNKGETVNVSWDNKQTAFYYKSVVKINA
ncbi:hypothetical protein [Clostridium butyricum]|uniref:Uncharacterized protein n=1 Tax=Clostridium butyricum E4 str. BoNT E BL5262 TaxID=632245 RepID=C4IFC1_CLOBU|nr:hypothetical protein [Clostridium butyricum]EDT77021.1 hypothetical protein CBY_0594 [Clostridium butyricum 5521]EEP53332.1 conserved hypothetical protein [Clostridium butyricum E4 str. BoNT E BL5262]NFL32976.1 hypothetical protein [Clostridium butyricum]NFS17945.1 hypothetical protein [Clostridium butyricum]